MGRLEDSFDIEGMLEAGKLHNDLAQSISRWAREAGAFGEDWLHLGAGGCRLCPVCAKRTNEPAATPRTPWPLWRPTAWPCLSWPPPAA